MQDPQNVWHLTNPCLATYQLKALTATEPFWQGQIRAHLSQRAHDHVYNKPHKTITNEDPSWTRTN